MNEFKNRWRTRKEEREEEKNGEEEGREKKKGVLSQTQTLLSREQEARRAPEQSHETPFTSFS